MKTMYFNHAEYTADNILGVVEVERPDRIVILSMLEYFVQITHVFVNRCNELNVEIIVVLGCFKSRYNVEYFENIGLPIENVVFWGTHFFNYTLMNLAHREKSNPYAYTHKPFKHKFISLNNRSHFHRCALIEELAKQELLDKGIVTWIAHIDENRDYPFKYFDGKKRLLSDNFIVHLDSNELPDEFHESLFEVVSETNANVTFFTEKTVRNLLLKKPFFILGPQHMHRKLVHLGFRLYDEVIDYSFDDEGDLFERTRLLVNNIHNILKYDPNELYEILKPKLEYNYHKAMTIATDKDLIPTVFKESTVELGTLNNYLNADFKKIRYFNIWDSHGKDEGNITKEDLMPYNMVVIDQAVEFVYTYLSEVKGAVDKVISSARELDIPVKLLTSSRKYEPVEQLKPESLEYDKLEIIDSPGYWISRYFNTSLVPDFHSENINLNNIDILDNEVNLNEPITDLYISMNNLAHAHRCMMMDILAKHDMIQCGKIVWRDVIRQFDGDRTEVPDSIRAGYKYRYWTPIRMYLDQKHLNSNVTPELFPSQYKNCFMQLVCETAIDMFYISEKTAAPLLYNKIFLTCGGKDFHKNLVDMGFKLFDNLFDYSFDSIDDHWDRFEGIIKNIKRYKDMSMDELTKLHSENEHIIRHNREIALDYVFNRVPKQFEMVDAILRGEQNFGIPNRLNGLYGNLHLKDKVIHNNFRQA